MKIFTFSGICRRSVYILYQVYLLNAYIIHIILKLIGQVGILYYINTIIILFKPSLYYCILV